MICKTNSSNYKCSISNITKDSLIDIKMHDLHLKNIFTKYDAKNLTCAYTLLQEKDALILEVSLLINDINLDNINFQSIDERKVYTETAKEYIILTQNDNSNGWFGPLTRYVEINKKEMLFEFITDEKYSKIIYKVNQFETDREISNFVVIQENSRYKYLFNCSELGSFIFQK